MWKCGIKKGYRNAKKQNFSPAHFLYLNLNFQAPTEPQPRLQGGTFNMTTWREKTSNTELQTGSDDFL